MPFISTEDVSQIRKELKQLLPSFKISVKRVNFVKVTLVIQSGPLEAPNQLPYQTVNEYHIDRSFDEPWLSVLKQSLAILSGSRYIEREDSDYGSIPNYYISIMIGDFDKPYLKI